MDLRSFRPDRPFINRTGIFLVTGVLTFPLVAALVASALPRLAYLAGACLFSCLLGHSWLPRLWAGRNRPQPAEPR